MKLKLEIDTGSGTKKVPVDIAVLATPLVAILASVATAPVGIWLIVVHFVR